MKMNVPETLRWNDGLELLDQRVLPGRVSYLQIASIADAVEAIRTLAVRGAPAIGVAAAYALAQSLRGVDDAQFATTLNANAKTLIDARPTAVNLAWACNRVRARGEQEPNAAALLDEARSIHEEDVEQCRKIGEHGEPLIPDGGRVLTHCNAGSLAVSAYGTATAPMYLAHANNKQIHVYADETRPLLQGARLTAWELDRAGIPVTLICDNMAATLMSQGAIDLILVGTDRVARNGDVANKIGTLGLAVLANHFGVPFYVACPSSTYDASTPTGKDIPIEQRAPEEVLGEHAAAVDVYNPAFDVTPAHLVTGIITERGQVMTPTEERMVAHFGASTP